MYRITSEQITTTPVSNILYGHFIELGYGNQVEPMRTEMLFNRSFEVFPSYKWINKEWYDLWIDPNDPSKGYKTDWSSEDWYHSGYEHNPWFAVPGEEGCLEIVDGSDFIIGISSTGNVTINRVEGASKHGESFLKVVNSDSMEWGGFAQSGKVLKASTAYHFRGFLRADVKDLQVEVRIYPEGTWGNPLFRKILTPIGLDWTEISCEFENSEYSGRAVFSVWIPPGTTLSADCFSLSPVDTCNGWRKEVVDAARRVNPKVIRWPGGCFASFYNWRDGIGPYNSRKPQPSYFWGGQNSNDVGTAELAGLAQRLGAESMVCVNIYHPSKKLYDVYVNEEHKGSHGFDFPEFADRNQGARDAADWVAYCNLPAGSHPMADLRASHGYPEPFGVRFWEMDNESLRWFKPKEYAEAVIAYSRAMKSVDPTIKIGMITYGDEYKAMVGEMLDRAGLDIDFLADRAWGEDGMLRVLEPMKAYNLANNTNIKYCDTEWLAYQDEPDAFNNVTMLPWHTETKSYRFGKWRYAMNIFRNFMMWQRYGGDVLFVNFNNFANTHSQCTIDTPKEGAYLSAAGRVFELLSRSPAAWPLSIEGYEVDSRADFQIQAAWDLDRTNLVLYVFNMTEEQQTAKFDISSLDQTFFKACFDCLHAGSLTAMNTLENPESIVLNTDVQTGLQVSRLYEVVTRSRSITQVVLSRQIELIVD